MKNLIRTLSLSALVLLLVSLGSVAQNTPNKLRPKVGLEYQMSYNHNWGPDRPVVLSVEPGSPADKAGIKVGDIIEAVNGKNSIYLPEIDFIHILESGSAEPIELTVSNFGYHNRKVELRPAYPTSHWTEKKLAQAFGMYSLEDESEQKIAYPFDTGREWKSSFFGKKRFGMVEGSSYTDLDWKIRNVTKKTLEDKGMIYSEESPEMLVDFYYSVVENPTFDKHIASKSQLYSLRYTPYTSEVEAYPFLPMGTDKRAARQELTLGIRIYDMTQEGKLVWSCEATEWLTEEFPLDIYSELSVPMMLMQYPFIRYAYMPIIRIAQHRHYYTGLTYHRDDLTLIESVEEGSPAYQAGIRAGDRILSINSLPLSSLESLSASYLAFMRDAYKYRDFRQTINLCSSELPAYRWNPYSYRNIRRSLRTPVYQSALSYLFAFRPYITAPSKMQGVPKVTFEVVRDMGIFKVEVEPVIHDYSYTTLE